MSFVSLTRPDARVLGCIETWNVIRRWPNLAMALTLQLTGLPHSLVQMLQGPVALGGGQAMHSRLSAASLGALLQQDADRNARGTDAPPDDWVQADALPPSPTDPPLLAAAVAPVPGEGSAGSTVRQSPAASSPLSASQATPEAPTGPPAMRNSGGRGAEEGAEDLSPSLNGIHTEEAESHEAETGGHDDAVPVGEEVPRQPVDTAPPAFVDAEQCGDEAEPEAKQGGGQQLSFDIRNCRALGSGLPHSLAGAAAPGQEAAIRRVLGADAASGAAVSRLPHLTVHTVQTLCVTYGPAVGPKSSGPISRPLAGLLQTREHPIQ